MYEVRLPVFHGPLELLLHLIEKRQLDITTLSLIDVTEQYMENIRSMERVDMAALADFLVIAAKLLYIKSLSLLPQPPPQTPPEEEDPGEELTRLLEEYKRFRAVAMDLKTRDEDGLRAYSRLAPPPKLEPRPGPLELSLSELIVAMEKVLLRSSVAEVPVVERRVFTVVDRIRMLKTMLSSGVVVKFSLFVADCPSREALVVSFLSVLELIKAREIEVRQETLFGEILIYPTLAV